MRPVLQALNDLCMNYAAQSMSSTEKEEDLLILRAAQLVHYPRGAFPRFVNSVAALNDAYLQTQNTQRRKHDNAWLECSAYKGFAQVCCIEKLVRLFRSFASTIRFDCYRGN